MNDELISFLIVKITDVSLFYMTPGFALHVISLSLSLSHCFLFSRSPLTHFLPCRPIERPQWVERQ